MQLTFDHVSTVIKKEKHDLISINCKITIEKQRSVEPKQKL